MFTQSPPHDTSKFHSTDAYVEYDPGTVLQGRYEVIDKLGAGRHSSVWLARDTTTKVSPLRAVKILTSRSTRIEFDKNESSYELEVLEIIRSTAQRLPEEHGHQHILQFLDHFTIKSPYGKHLALVTNVLGHHIGELQAQWEDRTLLPPVVRSICRQLLQALAFLHDECKIVHTDIKQDNVIMDDFGAEETDLAEVSVSLADFGESVPEHGDHRKLIQPATLRCPEVLAGMEWDIKADIWNLGCFIFELLTGKRLFVSQESRDENGKLRVTRSQFHFAHIYSHLRLPHESVDMFDKYFSQGGVPSELFTKDGKLRVKVSNQMSLEEILRHYGVYSPELLELLQGMLRVLPQDRLSARELLSKSWLYIQEPETDDDAEPGIVDEVQDFVGDAE